MIKRLFKVLAAIFIYIAISYLVGVTLVQENLIFGLIISPFLIFAVVLFALFIYKVIIAGIVNYVAGKDIIEPLE